MVRILRKVERPTRGARAGAPLSNIESSMAGFDVATCAAKQLGCAHYANRLLQLRAKRATHAEEKGKQLNKAEEGGLSAKRGFIAVRRGGLCA